MLFVKKALLLLFTACMAGCGRAPSTASNLAPALTSPSLTAIPTVIPSQPVPTSVVAEYAFPASIDPEADYLFYLHGKIIEDQGLPAISPDYGEYEYAAILEALQGYDYVVISEQRAANADGIEYARRVAGQVTMLLVAGVPPEHITVVGASKGAGIAIYVSHTLAN